MIKKNIDRDDIRKVLLEHFVRSSSLIDKIEEMVAESAGYSFAKNEKELVSTAAESLSE
jgi:hypothetical protein